MAVTNPNSWEFTQKMIRIGHNRAVKLFFKDIKADNRRDTGRAALKKSLLIQPEDSALEVMNKQLYFRLALDSSEDAVATQPERWVIKPGADVPHLIVVFRPTEKTRNRTGNYSLSIPHYNGHRNPKIPFYRKGQWCGTLTLKDNTKLIVNAYSKSEAERVIKVLSRYVEHKYLTTDLEVIPRSGPLLSKIRVKPIRADFYPDGRLDTRPKWRDYL